MPLNIPWPDSLFEVTWALIGFTFARAFGKQLDQDIQNSQWFKSLRAHFIFFYLNTRALYFRYPTVCANSIR